MQGTEADFDAFYRGTARRVIHLVYASTGDLTLAQDCTQEAYARAWQQWSTVHTYDDPLAWVRTVARRLAISAWRKTHRARSGPTSAMARAPPRPPGPRARTASPSSRPCARWPIRCARPSPCTTSAT